jgi:hypothetical protein
VQTAADDEAFIAELRAGLPPEAAEQAIEIYRGFRRRTQ